MHAGIAAADDQHIRVAWQVLRWVLGRVEAIPPPRGGAEIHGGNVAGGHARYSAANFMRSCGRPATIFRQAARTSAPPLPSSVIASISLCFTKKRQWMGSEARIPVIAS